MLPSEVLELSILEFVRIPGAERWRSTSLPSLAVSVKCQDWNEVADALIRLHARKIINVRKWIDQQGFVAAQLSPELTRFFNSGEFQMEITAEGRVYAETLSERKKLDNAPLQASEISMSAAVGGLLQNETKMSEAIREALHNRSIFEQQTIEIVRGFQEPLISTKAMQDALAKINLGNESFYKSLVENFQINDQQYWNSVALALEPTLNSLSQIGSEIAKQMVETSKAMESALSSAPFQGAMKGLLDQAAIIASLNLKVPDLTRLYWPKEVLLERLPLVEDSVWNARALEVLRESVVNRFTQIETKEIATIETANQFVKGHVQLVRALPPAVSFDDVNLGEDEFRGCNEEIGAKLEQELMRVGVQFVELRRAAWRNLKANSAAGARMAMTGIRELFSDVLHLLAADDELKKTEIWLNRTERDQTRPTRRMRLQFIVGERLAEFDALVQFDRSIQNANKFTHTFGENPELVRIAISQVENCLYLLLVSSRHAS